ncbi:hypothetical protein MIND_00041400 [Mycena indigotica]|uniref:Mediator complex subunit 1 n=1 Tax=Mycena indigotica TaxID=2126181 RepID=A0A8H6TD38_9AGAR|nr:uncharacterized protein MIND_00041400 [Mycena indigotica]KAF7315270.1 hypothetical protein MIND_00041400 [Mycena indigotica]
MTSPKSLTTLLSTVHDILSKPSPENATHPFSLKSEEAIATLGSVIDTTGQLATSLNSYTMVNWTNTKLVSLLRQQTSITETIHGSKESTRQVIKELRKRSGTNSNYGEDIPIEPQAVVDWCISKLQAWATSVGLEAYREDENKAGVLLAGLVFAMDVEFVVSRENPLRPRIDVASVTTAYSGSTDTTPSLDSFMARTIQNFCDELNKAEQARDPRRVAKLGSCVIDQLRYLKLLDPLAKAESPPEDKPGENFGVRWFTDTDKLYLVLQNLCQNEARAVASSVSLDRAPLDIYLVRCHAIALPYLISPSITFLVHVSPTAYLAMKNSSSESGSELDISLENLRSYLSLPRKGICLATLLLSSISVPQLFPQSLSMPSLLSRPTFPLVPEGSEIEHSFPEAVLTAGPQHMWTLDFTQGGQVPGVILSQSRLHEIELIIHPLGGIDTPLTLNVMSFGTGSWVAALLNPLNPVSSERYTALYRSPSNLHPPLQLRLTLPEEPGFLLEKVPVHSLKEVWAVLEVVREQCWLNEILLGCHWSTEGIANDDDDVPVDESDATEEQLLSVLNGTLTPQKIPVNVSLPQRTDPVFDPSLDSITMPSVDRRTKILMTSPERPPISGVVEITVAYDETRPRAVSVELSGAIGCDIKSETLEEIVRRGGALGLSGRIWANSAKT